MIVNKQFAQEGAVLDDCLDQLVEVLAQLLEEAPNPPAAGAGTAAIGDLRSGTAGAIHVVVNK